jgi:hypothetical protein
VARRYLADDLSLLGPGAAFKTADASSLKASEHARWAVKAVVEQKVFAEGPDVCIF